MRLSGTTCAAVLPHWIEGADQAAADIGLKPLLSGVKTEDEGLYTVQHRYWLQEMKKATAAQTAQEGDGQ